MCLVVQLPWFSRNRIRGSSRVVCSRRAFGAPGGTPRQRWSNCAPEKAGRSVHDRLSGHRGKRRSDPSGRPFSLVLINWSTFSQRLTTNGNAIIRRHCLQAISGRYPWLSNVPQANAAVRYRLQDARARESARPVLSAAAPVPPSFRRIGAAAPGSALSGFRQTLFPDAPA